MQVGAAICHPDVRQDDKNVKYHFHASSWLISLASTVAHATRLTDLLPGWYNHVDSTSAFYV
jgi:hypothetical protein